MTKQPVAIQDVYDFSTLSGVKVSPTGRWTAFVESRADEKKNGYNSYIWLYDAETKDCRRLTGHGSDRVLCWQDDTTLLLTSGRKPRQEGEPEQMSRIFSISVLGGEAQEMCVVPESMGEMFQVHQDLWLIKVSRDHSGRDKEINKCYQVFDEIPFWFNGRGFANQKRSALCLFTPSTGEVKTLAGDQVLDVGGVALAPSGKKAVYTALSIRGKRVRESGLFAVDLETGACTTLIPEGEKSLGGVQFLSENKVYVGYNAVHDSHSHALPYCFDLETGAFEPLKNEDVALSGMVHDGGQHYVCHDHDSASRLCRMEMDGKLTPLPLPEGMAVMSFDVKKGRVMFVAEKVDGLQELYTLENGEAVQVSRIHDDYIQRHCILPLECFTFQNRAGIRLDGFILRPGDFDPGKKYPGLLEIHGGPKARYNPGFNHEMQSYAAKGYIVFFCNPRGSSGRSSDFADVTGKLGTIDYEDIMDFTDEVLRRESALDANRLGVLGGSYGGFMTNWIIGHTDRFKAACSQRSISNYVTKCLTTDIGYMHNLTQMETDPWTDFHVFWDHSPLKYADKCKTPTLFIHSDHDFRCWMSEGIQMHQALCRFGVPTRLCLFADENHELSRSGRPKGRIGRLQEMLDWFDQYLK